MSGRVSREAPTKCPRKSPALQGGGEDTSIAPKALDAWARGARPEA